MKYLFYASLGIVLFAGCSGHATGDAASTDSLAADTLPPEIAWLPDTVFPSAAGVQYNLETSSEIDGHITSLADLYSGGKGVYTFRGGLQRHADYNGKLKGEPTDVEIDWSYRTKSSPTWGGGSGWTGQPLYVEWPDSCLKSGVGKASKEIIVGSLDGNVHFIDYASGSKSREPIGRGNPIKGTVSLDPTLNGNLYVGEGIPDSHPFGAYVIDLYKGSVTDLWPEDPKAPRHWYAYDSSPLRLGNFLFRPGENSCLYKFAIDKGALKLQSALRYRVDGVGPGIESSMAIYANYGFIGDNRGNVIAVNLETMKPVWLVRLGDDIDASIVLEEENGVPYIYASTEIDKQGMEGEASFAKIRATDGEVVWNKKFPGARAELGEKMFDGGFYASPLLGTDNCKDLIYSSRVLNTHGMNGELIALDRKTGKTLWSKPLPYYGWSSPVAMTADNGRMYVIVGDGAGNINIFDGKDGRQLVKKNIGHNFESSPVVVGNSMVVGSRGDTIFKLTVKSEAAKTE